MKETFQGGVKRRDFPDERGVKRRSWGSKTPSNSAEKGVKRREFLVKGSKTPCGFRGEPYTNFVYKNEPLQAIFTPGR